MTQFTVKSWRPFDAFLTKMTRMDFDEAAESAVAKRKLLLNRLMKKKLLPDDDDEEEVAEGEVLTLVWYTQLAVWLL